LGRAGNDTLVGGDGADSLYGEAGNDTYYADKFDFIFDSQGIDTVLSYDSLTLALGCDNWTALGSDNINGTGNSLNNQLTGNTGSNQLDGDYGNDKLSGQDGVDILEGMAGKDTLTGGAGADTFYFSADLFGAATRALTAADADVITDFTPGVDTLNLVAFDGNKFGFEGLRNNVPEEPVNPSAFLSKAGAKAALTADQRLVYDSKSGILYYDSDGVGGAKAFAIVTLIGKPALTSSDLIFTVFD
jgi:Ca2+-binding RTX toxin-like protein